MLKKAWMIPENAERSQRKPRAKTLPTSILVALKSEKLSHISGGIYHRLQIDFTYNTNHMEGSRLTSEQTRWIFKTKTIGDLPNDLPIDDIIETANHFRCITLVIESADATLTERYIKMLHAQLKSGTCDSRKDWFAVGDYKWLDNVVGEIETCPAKDVRKIYKSTRYIFCRHGSQVSMPTFRNKNCSGQVLVNYNRRNKIPINPDDPAVLEKLDAKLNACIKLQETMKAVNTIVQSNHTDEEKRKLLMSKHHISPQSIDDLLHPRNKAGRNQAFPVML